MPLPQIVTERITISSNSVPSKPDTPPAYALKLAFVRSTHVMNLAQGEAARAMKNGALGVQIYTNVAGRPLDNPEFKPFW